jgi:hypothetical protein
MPVATTGTAPTVPAPAEFIGQQRRELRASSENHTVRLPRWRSAAAYVVQFVTRCRCLGMWCRRSAFALNGNGAAPEWWRGFAPARSLPQATPPADPCNNVPRRAGSG